MGQQTFNAQRFSGFHLPPEEVRIVGIDIAPSDDLSYLYDTRCHDPIEESMVLNIMVYGVVEPIVVTKIDEFAYVVDGRGRVRCAREANIRLTKEGKEPLRVPAVVRRGVEHELFGVSISANEIRRDDNNVVKGEKAQKFLNMGRSIEEVARAFGVSTQAINQWLSVLSLAAPVREMVRSGELSSNAAIKLAKLSHKEQVAAATTALEKAKAKGTKVTGRSMGASTENKPLFPSKRVVKKIVEMKEHPAIPEEHNNFWSGMKFMMGELSLKDVGLSEIVTTIEQEKEEVQKASSEKAEARKAEKEKKKAEKEKKKAEKEKKKAEKEEDKARRAEKRAKAAEGKNAEKSSEASESAKREEAWLKYMADKEDEADQAANKQDNPDDTSAPAAANTSPPVRDGAPFIAKKKGAKPDNTASA